MIAVAAAVALSVALTPADRFLDELRCALARGDRAAVARMFEYPAMIVARGARVPVQDRSTLIKLYDLAFPPELQNVIAMARVIRDAKRPRPYGVVVDGSSLMIGDAWLWARRVGAQYRIARIILPAAWVTIGSGTVATPRRIELQRRQASTLLSGALNPYEMQSYIVGAIKGQELALSLEGFPGRDVVLRVLNRNTGQPIDEKAADGVRRWTAKMNADGDVRIDVLRLSPKTKPVPLYVLSVALR